MSAEDYFTQRLSEMIYASPNRPPVSDTVLVKAVRLAIANGVEPRLVAEAAHHLLVDYLGVYVEEDEQDYIAERLESLAALEILGYRGGTS